LKTIRVNEAPPRRGIGANHALVFVRPLGVFAPWRLQAYGYTIAAFYAGIFLYLYKAGIWLLDGNGRPLYEDFTCAFVAGLQALHGEVASIYIPAEFIKAQETLVGTGRALFSNWPYPPTYFLILAPLAALPYTAALLTWGLATLLGYVVVVYLIVRRPPAIAMALSSPFAAWNFIAGQSGALTALLLGGALLALERRPVLAGVFIAGLTYKPQWGILIPVALLAARQWRTIATSAATTAVLVGLSIVAFGPGPWAEFPRELLAQAHLNLFISSERWGLSQSVYGLIRYLHGAPVLAWLAQGLTTSATAFIVWVVWRSQVRYALKAATLSAAVLIATPYAFPYDLVAIAIPVAYLAKDQISYGLRRGEQSTLLVLFVASFCIFVIAGKAPGGVVIVLALLGLILRRTLRCRSAPLPL
jgi:hypothetical protein